MTPAKRKRTRTKRFNPRFPFQAENLLYKSLESHAKAYSKMVTKPILGFVDQRSGLRKDATAYDITRQMEQFITEVDQLFAGDTIYAIGISIFIGKTFDRIVENNINELERLLELYGVDGYPLVLMNYDLLKRQYMDRIRSQTREAVKAFLDKLLLAFFSFSTGNMTLNALKKRINVLTKSFTTARPLFISRDITGDFSSHVWRSLYQELGMDKYIWNTQQDELVRGNPTGKYPKAIPSHYEMQGVVCSWSDESIMYKNGKLKQRTGIMPKAHPGEPHNCRCTPLAYIENDIQQIDRELGDK